MNSKQLILGFYKKDNQKVKYLLSKLLPHLRLKNLILVGGIAIRHHILDHNLKYPKREFNDLDLSIKSPGELKPSIMKDFLIYHYHPLKNNSFYIVLLDPETRIKIDIFDYNPPPVKPETIYFADFKLKIRSIEDQLRKTVSDLLKVKEGFKVDPKQFADARKLLQIVSLNKVKREKIKQIIDQAEKINPNLIVKKPFYKDKPYKCPNCQAVKNFPITPMKNIFRLLGHIE